MKIGKVRLEFKVSSLTFLIFVYMAGWGLIDQGELDLTAHFFLTTIFAAGIFLSALAHEFSHLAVRNYYWVVSEACVRFHWFGANLLTTLSRAKRVFTLKGELTLFLSGIAANAFLAVFFWLVASFRVFANFNVVFENLSHLNLGYAILNLVPVYPLDGGRVSQASLRRILGSRQKSQKVSLFLTIFLCAGVFLLSVYQALAREPQPFHLFLMVVSLWLLDFSYDFYKKDQGQEKRSG